MFEFFAPIFAVAGAVAAAIPIALHMLRRTPSQREYFSLVKLLKPTPPRVTRRSTIEHWPLMLLRILALILIALAFGRPFQNIASTAELDEPQTGRRIALLIDSSASMRRDGLRQAVTEVVTRIADDLRSQDVVSLTFFDQTSRTVISPDVWLASDPDVRAALLRDAIADWEPTWFATRTGAALLNAAEDVADEQPGNATLAEREVILITDFQRGSTLDELQATSFPASVAVRLEVVSPEQPGNTGVHLIADDPEGRLRVRVVSSADAQQTEFQLAPFDASGGPVGDPVPVSIAPGQRRSILLPTTDEATQVLTAGVELVGDLQPFDNVIDLPITEVPILRIAHVGSADPNDPATMRYYLQRVIDGNDQDPMELLNIIQPDNVVLPVPEDIRLVVVTAPVPAGLIGSIQACLEREGVLLVAAADVETLASIEGLLPTPLKATEAEVDDYAMLGRVDYSHPVFQAFAGARFSDLSSIRFWKHRNVEVPVDNDQWNTVARFDDGSPAIFTANPDGGGTIVITASGWHPDDSQWALSTRFPPMILAITRMAMPRIASQLSFTVGDSLDPAAVLGADDWSLQDVEGNTVAAASLTATEDAEQSAQIQLTEPGRFTLTGTKADENIEYSVIVGLSASESRTEPLPLGQLQALGIEATAAATDGQSTESAVIPADQLRASELESQQKLWRWFLLAGLGCLLLENMIASRIERRQIAAVAGE